MVRNDRRVVSFWATTASVLVVLSAIATAWGDPIPAATDHCTRGEGLTAFDGWIGSSAYLRLQSVAATDGATLGCAQVAYGAVNQSLVLRVSPGSAGLNAPYTDANAGSCEAAKAQNTVPGFHPIIGNTVAGSTRVFADAYNGPGAGGRPEQWLCVGVVGVPVLGDVTQRLVIQSPLTFLPPNAQLGTEQPAPAPPARMPWQNIPKANSKICEASGGQTLISAAVGGDTTRNWKATNVWLGIAQPTANTILVCERSSNDPDGGIGGYLTLRLMPPTAGDPRLVLQPSNDSSACTVPVDHNDNPYLDVRMSPVPANPVTVCIDEGGLILPFKATTAGITGVDPAVPLPPIDAKYTTDAAPE